MVPSVAVTEKVEVVFEETALAVPAKVPLELSVIPLGNDPAVTENVILSPSSSVAVTAVRLDPAPLVVKVPKEPEATPNTGAASMLKALSKMPEKPDEVFVT